MDFIFRPSVEVNLPAGVRTLFQHLRIGDQKPATPRRRRLGELPQYDAMAKPFEPSTDESTQRSSLPATNWKGSHRRQT